MPFIELFRRFVERHRHRTRRLAAAHRLGHDQDAWAELFRRDEWAPLPAGHLGRCGRCGTPIELAHHDCPKCGAVWGANARKGDLARQILVIGAAVALSVLAGYGSGPAMVSPDFPRAAGNRRSLPVGSDKGGASRRRHRPIRSAP